MALACDIRVAAENAKVKKDRHVCLSNCKMLIEGVWNNARAHTHKHTHTTHTPHAYTHNRIHIDKPTQRRTLWCKKLKENG